MQIARLTKYALTIISVVIITTIGYSIYEHENKKSIKSHRVSCHKSTTTFERVLDRKYVKDIQNALQNGDYSLHVEELPSEYMPTRLFEFVDKADIKNRFINLFSKPNGKDIKVQIFIYENDKLDPKKQTKKSKLYEGYLLFNFKYKNSDIYKLQLDFYDNKGKDIPKLLTCAKESLISL